MADDVQKNNDKVKYNDLKAAVKKLEEKNYSRLILFKSGKDWYKMAGNSLLIYKNSIATQLKVRVNIQPDTDYTKTIFEEGIVSFRGTDGLKKRLEEAGRLRAMNEVKNLVVFDLNFVTAQRQIEEFRRNLLDEQERSLAVLKPDIVLLPEVYGKIRYIQKRIFETVRKMSVYEREYNGLVMSQYSREMTKYYMMMNNEMISEEEGWKKVLEMANLLIIEVTFVTELKVIRQDVGVNIGADLMDVRHAAERKIEKLGGENVKGKTDR